MPTYDVLDRPRTETSKRRGAPKGSVLELQRQATRDVAVRRLLDPSVTAGFMERAGAAVVIPDRELTPARLANEVGRLLADPGRLTAMARASAALARPHAAQDIADELMTAARGA